MLLYQLEAHWTEGTGQRRVLAVEERAAQGYVDFAASSALRVLEMTYRLSELHVTLIHLMQSEERMSARMQRQVCWPPFYLPKTQDREREPGLGHRPNLQI